MRHRIVHAEARADFSLALRFAEGQAAAVDLAPLVATGEVTRPLRDEVGGLRIGGDGAWIAWPGEVEIDADALWYRSHPDDLERNYGPEAA